MGWFGLKNDNIIKVNLLYGERLQIAEQHIYSHSKEGRVAEFAAKKLAKILTHAIKSNDINLIFILERQALERDIACYGADSNRNASLASLEQASVIFERTSTPEGARNFLLAITGGKELPKKIPQSDLFQNFIKTRKSHLSAMIGSTASPALKLYHSRRKEALEHIKKEYLKNLNLGLGKEIKHAKEFSR